MLNLMNREVYALSWRQPYASLMLHGKIETRTWNTHYRGYVLICATKVPYNDDQLRFISGNHTTRINKLIGDNIPLGMAIAVGQIVDCRPMVPEDEAKCFVKYYPGLYCHIYDRVLPIEPFTWKGNQGWKLLGQDVKSQIHFVSNKSRSVKQSASTLPFVEGR